MGRKQTSQCTATKRGQEPNHTKHSNEVWAGNKLHNVQQRSVGKNQITQCIATKCGQESNFTMYSNEAWARTKPHNAEQRSVGRNQTSQCTATKRGQEPKHTMHSNEVWAGNKLHTVQQRSVGKNQTTQCIATRWVAKKKKNTQCTATKCGQETNFTMYSNDVWATTPKNTPSNAWQHFGKKQTTHFTKELGTFPVLYLLVIKPRCI